MLNDNGPLLCGSRIQSRLQLNVQFGFLFFFSCMFLSFVPCLQSGWHRLVPQKTKQDPKIESWLKLATNQTQVKRSHCCKNSPDALCTHTTNFWAEPRAGAQFGASLTSLLLSSQSVSPPGPLYKYCLIFQLQESVIDSYIQRHYAVMMVALASAAP